MREPSVLKYGYPPPGATVVERHGNGPCWYEVPRGEIPCTNCEAYDSNPRWDGMVSTEGIPDHLCDECADEIGLD